MAARPQLEMTVTGYAAADPEMRFTQSGKPVANVSIPYTPRRYDQQTQQWEDAGETIWVTASFWDKDAEPAQQAIRKGTPVTVTGTPKISAYTGKDGQPRASLNLTARSWGVQPASRPQQPAPQAAASHQADPWGDSPLDPGHPPF